MSSNFCTIDLVLRTDILARLHCLLNLLYTIDIIYLVKRYKMKGIL